MHKVNNTKQFNKEFSCFLLSTIKLIINDKNKIIKHCPIISVPNSDNLVNLTRIYIKDSNEKNL